MTEEAITELAIIAPERIAVIARTTAMHDKGTRKDAARIGRELHADHLVEGGVRRDAGRVAITVQLIRVHDQTHVFANRCEANLGEVFEMRTRIAEDLAAHLDDGGGGVKGTGRGAPRRKPTADVAAYNEYIRSRYLSRRATPESLGRARPHFENAISRDPEFALAHVALADLHALTGYYGYMRPRDAFAIGMLHAARAVELDPALAEAHAILGEYHKQLDYDWQYVYDGLGDLDMALEWFDRAVEERDQMMMPILSFPEDIRRHPRYPALVRKMKLG